MRPLISIIIPTLNEEGQLPDTLAPLAAAAGCEVIVSDGGSGDATRDLAVRHGCRVVRSPPGRGVQMNAGAAAAHAPILLFLHADTLLPPGFAPLVESALAEQNVSGGAFSLRISGDRPGLAFIAHAANLRSRLLRLPYGDQALFTTSETFQRLGGFAETPIMEDVLFVRGLRRLGRLVILPQAVVTSSRRWDNLGLLRTTLINQLILLGHGCGIPAPTLARCYRRLRGLGRKED